MKGYYINLDSSVERREAFEKELKKYALEKNIKRVSAIDGKKVTLQENDHIQWKKKPPSKRGLWLTFEKIFEENMGSDENIFLFEDDAVIGKNFLQGVEWLSKNLPDEDWDIIYFDCDVRVLDLNVVYQLFKAYENFKNSKNFLFLDAGKAYMAGNSSVLINKNSIEKLYNLFATGKVHGLPNDIFIRYLINENILKGLVLFPFVNAVSDHAKKSTLVAENTMINSLIDLRQKLFIESDFNDPNFEQLIEKKLLKAKETYLKIVKEIIDDKFILF